MYLSLRVADVIDRRLGHRESGAMAVIAAIMLSVISIGLCSIVVDLGMARDTRRQAQNAADASALGAGNVLYLAGLPANVTAAVAAVKSSAAKNYAVTTAEWASCRDDSALPYQPDSPDTCISFDSAAPGSIRVSIPVRQVTTPFAGVWGTSQVPVSAVAQIQLSSGARAPCGVCIIGSGTHDLQNSTISVSGANVGLNGTLVASPSGRVTVTGGGINLEGSVPNQGCCSPAPSVNQPTLADPLATLSMPDYSGLTAKSGSSCTGGPGIYSTLAGGSSCTMSPGLYVVTGSSNINGGNSIVANGVTLYFICGTPTAPRACNSGESGGGLKFQGSGTLTITAPASGPTAGLSIIADRNNAATFTFHGNTTVANSGTVYLKSATLDYQGTSTTVSTDSLIIVGNLTATGGAGVLTSSYTQSSVNVVIPLSYLNLSE